jgi:hypothetical protein
MAALPMEPDSAISSARYYRLSLYCCMTVTEAVFPRPVLPELATAAVAPGDARDAHCRSVKAVGRDSATFC